MFLRLSRCSSILCGFVKKQSLRFVVSRDLRATDSCRDGWNVQNGLSVPKILHSVDERIDGVLLLVLVLLLSKHSQVNMCLLGKVHESIDVIMKNWLHRLSFNVKTLLLSSEEMVVWIVSFVRTEIKDFALNLQTGCSRCNPADGMHECF